MPPRGIRSPGGGREVLESSQIDVENLVIETPTASSLLRAQDKECQDSDGEDRSVTDEADGNYQENIVSSKPLIVLKTSRVLRSNAVKHEPMQPGSPTSSQIETPNLAKRGREKHDDVATRPEKRVKKPAVDAKIEKYEKAFDEWLEDYKSKTQGLETFKTKNQELCMENNTLKKGLKKAQQDQKRMEALHSSEISLLQSECSKLRKKLEAAIDASKQDNLKYTKVSDSDITAEWGKLSFNIRDLVSQCLTKHPANENDEIETLMKRMKRFLPLSYCNVASLRAAVLRRMIWYIIKSAVFSGMRPIWYGAAGQMLTQVVYMASQGYINKSHCLNMASQMKQRAVASLNEDPQLHEKAEGAIYLLLEATKATVSKFIPDPMMALFEVKMKKIIMDAIDLHAMMMNSKAIFLQRWLGDDNNRSFTIYNREMMESMQSDVDTYTSRYVVEFVEAPGLVKYGNADGEDFEFNMILCKSSVIIRENGARSTLEDKTVHRAACDDKDFGKATAGSKSELEQ
ncbi:uncharacterized protein TrAFT101_003714 [Trichoderma asperellum]|uniref:uncharacterized protein n=1 Tax=Trichoderma asperellum TaxID=101201 RepID=UPI00332CD7BC|nr:hypothetical protein TrAFT101_003714 [Trichoderma asperellum]